MKNKVISVIKYTVERSIRNKWFIILNILLLAIALVSINFTTITSILKTNNISLDKEINIVVVDNEDLIYDKLESGFANTNYKDLVKLQQENEIKEYTNETLKDNTIVIEVKKSDENMIDTKIISKEGIDDKYYSVILDSVKSTRYEIFESKYLISKDILNKVTSEPYIERVTLAVDSSNSDQKQMIQMGSSYLVFLLLLIVLSKIAQDISQEKISKSIEYILTSMSAKGYLIAKVLSTNLVLLIQLLFSIVYFLISMIINSLINIYFINPNFTLDSSALTTGITNMVDTQMLVYIGVIFVYMSITMLILCVIQAALSSKTTDITEAGNATILLVTVNMVMYFLANFAIGPMKEPTIIIYILSCLPIVSMYFVPTMLLIGQATVIQVVVATIVLIGSVPLIFRVSSNIFKNGVLDYTNKKPKRQKESKKQTNEERESQIIVKKEYKKFGFVIGFSVILFIVLQLICSYALIPIVVPITNLFNGVISSENVYTIITMISFIISLVIPAMFVNMYVVKDKHKDNTQVENKEKNDKKDKKNFATYLKYVVIATPLVLIIQIVVGFILEKLGMDYDILDKMDIYNSTSTLSKILFFVQAAVLPAIFEELYIRKTVLNFSKKYGYIFAIIFSSILFAVIHMNISQGIFAFLMGVILSVVTIKTKSIIPAMLIHLLNNGYAVLATIFEENSNISLGINVVGMCIVLIGIYYIVKEIISLKKNKIKIEKIEKNSISIKDYKYIFFDYTMIIATILVVVMLIFTQNMISLL